MSEPKVYVGTYAKYNNGSIQGEWIELEDFAGLCTGGDDFWAMCAEIHSDEDDPEFIFQDWENIPDGLISESSIDDGLWEWLRLDDDQREIVSIYREHIDKSESIDRILERYRGEFSSKGDYAEQFMDDCYEIPDHLASYIDYEKFANDCELGGDVTFVETSHCCVHVFDNH